MAGGTFSEHAMSGSMNRIDNRELLGFVERYERLETERDALKEDQKVVIAEAGTKGSIA